MSRCYPEWLDFQPGEKITGFKHNKEVLLHMASDIKWCQRCQKHTCIQTRSRLAHGRQVLCGQSSCMQSRAQEILLASDQIDSMILMGPIQLEMFCDSMCVLSQASANSHAWRQHPGQEDAPPADLAFVMRHKASASPKSVKSHQQDLQPLALEGCWQTATAASLTKRGRE